MKELKLRIRMLLGGMAMLLVTVAVAWAAPLTQPFPNQGAPYGGTVDRNAPYAEKAPAGKMPYGGTVDRNAPYAEKAPAGKMPYGGTVDRNAPYAGKAPVGKKPYGGTVERNTSHVKKAAAGKARLPGEKINVNTASAAELSKLPGVGPKIAKEIGARRTTYGPFKSPRDLLEVKGIGKKVLSGMMDDIAF